MVAEIDVVHFLQQGRALADLGGFDGATEHRDAQQAIDRPGGDDLEAGHAHHALERGAGGQPVGIHLGVDLSDGVEHHRGGVVFRREPCQRARDLGSDRRRTRPSFRRRPYRDRAGGVGGLDEKVSALLDQLATNEERAEGIQHVVNDAGTGDEVERGRLEGGEQILDLKARAIVDGGADGGAGEIEGFQPVGVRGDDGFRAERLHPEGEQTVGGADVEAVLAAQVHLADEVKDAVERAVLRGAWLKTPRGLEITAVDGVKPREFVGESGEVFGAEVGVFVGSGGRAGADECGNSPTKDKQDKRESMAVSQWQWVWPELPLRHRRQVEHIEACQGVTKVLGGFAAQWLHVERAVGLWYPPACKDRPFPPASPAAQPDVAAGNRDFKRPFASRRIVLLCPCAVKHLSPRPGLRGFSGPSPRRYCFGFGVAGEPGPTGRVGSAPSQGKSRRLLRLLAGGAPMQAGDRRPRNDQPGRGRRLRVEMPGWAATSPRTAESSRQSVESSLTRTSAGRSRPPDLHRGDLRHPEAPASEGRPDS